VNFGNKDLTKMQVNILSNNQNWGQSKLNTYIMEYEKGIESVREPLKLPSKFQVKEICSLLYGAIYIPNCRILKVHFSEDKVMYDVEIMYKVEDGKNQVSRVYNIDSAHVIPDISSEVYQKWHDDMLEYMRSHPEIATKLGRL
jgi:hypothetical protein